MSSDQISENKKINSNGRRLTNRIILPRPENAQNHASQTETQVPFNQRLRLSLFFLRAGIFIVMFMWTMDKFFNTEHSIDVFKRYYFLDIPVKQIILALAVTEFFLLMAFLAGLKKKLTYGAVLLLHTVSTLSAFKQYAAPWVSPNLLFYAAWPMLAACVALYLLRDEDTLLVLK